MGIARSGLAVKIGLTRDETSKEMHVNTRMGVVSPKGLQLAAAGAVSRHLDTLAGKTIGEVYNNHFKGELMFRTYRRLLAERFPGVNEGPDSGTYANQPASGPVLISSIVNRKMPPNRNIQ